MLPVVFGLLGLEAAAAIAADERNHYGAVSLWMGGRGTGAGRGTSTEMGGRVPSEPYEYSSPSSLVANWSTGTLFGADDDDGDDDVFGFKLFGIPFGRESRIEHLEGKIEQAEGKIEALEQEAMSVDDPSGIAGLATKIAKWETKKENWEGKLEKIQDRMGELEEVFGAREPDVVSAQTLRAVETLANNVLSNARKLRRHSRGKKAYTNLITLVASFDELVNLVDLSLRPALTTYSSRVGPRRSRVKATRAASVPDAYVPYYDSGPPPPMADLPYTERVGGHGRRVREAAPPDLSPEVQAAVNRASAAAEAYRQTRLEQPRAVQGMEERLHAAGQQARESAIERVRLFSTRR